MFTILCPKLNDSSECNITYYQYLFATYLNNLSPIVLANTSNNTVDVTLPAGPAIDSYHIYLFVKMFNRHFEYIEIAITKSCVVTIDPTFMNNLTNDLDLENSETFKNLRLTTELEQTSFVLKYLDVIDLMETDPNSITNSTTSISASENLVGKLITISNLNE